MARNMAGIMEKFFALARLGIRYLFRYRRRYVFLLAALIFGFAIVTVITSQKDGMSGNVYYSAQSHYAGDIIAIGYNFESDPSLSGYLGREEISIIREAANSADIHAQNVVLRTLYGSNGVVHYNGAALRLRYLVGCDWDAEAQLFGEMVFDEPPLLPAGDDGIILSLPAALELGARMGDMVILELETGYGQKNTGQFIVRGIVRETSIFGYFKAYIPRVSLNRLLLYDDEACSTVGFFLEKPSQAEQKRKLLQKELLGRLETGALVNNRDEMDLERSGSWTGTKVFLYTMPVYLSEIADLLSAMNMLSYFLYAIMLVIILVSAAVTYRLILHERTREIGVMRTIGFYGGDLRLVFWTEVMSLGFISLIGGFLLAAIINWGASFLSFSWFPGFDIFTKHGRLAALYLPETTLINAAFLFLILFFMMLFPSIRISQKKLPELLSGEPL